MSCSRLTCFRFKTYGHRSNEIAACLVQYLAASRAVAHRLVLLLVHLSSVPNTTIRINRREPYGVPWFDTFFMRNTFGRAIADRCLQKPRVLGLGWHLERHGFPLSFVLTTEYIKAPWHDSIVAKIPTHSFCVTSLPLSQSYTIPTLHLIIYLFNKPKNFSRNGTSHRYLPLSWNFSSCGFCSFLTSYKQYDKSILPRYCSEDFPSGDCLGWTPVQQGRMVWHCFRCHRHRRQRCSAYWHLPVQVAEVLSYQFPAAGRRSTRVGRRSDSSIPHRKGRECERGGHVAFTDNIGGIWLTSYYPLRSSTSPTFDQARFSPSPSPASSPSSSPNFVVLAISRRRQRVRESCFVCFLSFSLFCATQIDGLVTAGVWGDTGSGSAFTHSLLQLFSFLSPKSFQGWLVSAFHCGVAIWLYSRLWVL